MQEVQAAWERLQKSPQAPKLNILSRWEDPQLGDTFTHGSSPELLIVEGFTDDFVIVGDRALPLSECIPVRLWKGLIEVIVSDLKQATDWGQVTEVTEILDTHQKAIIWAALYQPGECSASPGGSTSGGSCPETPLQQPFPGVHTS